MEREGGNEWYGFNKKGDIVYLLRALTVNASMYLIAMKFFKLFQLLHYITLWWVYISLYF